MRSCSYRPGTEALAAADQGRTAGGRALGSIPQLSRTFRGWTSRRRPRSSSGSASSSTGSRCGVAERVLQGAQLHMPEESTTELDLLDLAAGDLGSARARSGSATSRRVRLGARAAAVSGRAAAVAASRAEAAAAAAAAAAAPGRSGVTAAVLVERNRPRDGDVQRLCTLGHRDRRDGVAPLEQVGRQARALGTEHERRALI